MSRFDYVKYDATGFHFQQSAKDKIQEVETLILSIANNSTRFRQRKSRSVALAITALEECYMWIGKAIRDEQLARNGVAPQEERTNS